MKPMILAVIALALGVTVSYAEEVTLTVYNNDLAIVKMTNEMSFKKGHQTVSLTGVADKIDPTSVRFSAKRTDVTILEQNYRYDLASSDNVLRRYIDREIAVRLKTGELIEGMLQSVAGDVVVRSRDGKLNVVRTDAIERYEFPELPEGLVTRPTLFWEMFSRGDITTPTEVSYMTGGCSWHAEYTAVVSDDERQMELSSWVSIDNTSGATFHDATLKLVAGDIHRAETPAPAFTVKMMRDEAEAPAPGGFEERGLFEYHLYALKGKTTIHNAEIKQVSLFEPASTKVEKQYVYDARKNDTKVSISVEFVNSEKDGLGMPLPAGVVRVYKRDVDGGLELVGEDRLDHTPKNETVRLMLGYAFDIVGERKQLEVKRISPRITEETVQISLRNRKDEPVRITAVERRWWDWEIIKSSIDYVKKDASTIEFTVNVPPDSEAVVTYTVRTK